MNKKLTLTLHECEDILRSYGIRCSARGIAAGFESGVYPFGRIKGVGRTGRRETEIFRADLEKWLREKGAEV